MNDIIQLHEVDTGQGVSPDGLTRLRTQRLNFFPDRPLGDDEFDRIQAWSDARMASLEQSLAQPGILDGLQCRLQDEDGEPGIQVLPGRGLGKNRQLYTLDHPLEQRWEALRDTWLSAPDTPNDPLNGLYLLVLKADFFHVDISPNQQPCQRDELDRLRDARIRRGYTLSLAAVDASLWQQQEVVEQPVMAANRMLGGLLQDDSKLPEYDGVSLALLGVEDNALLWLNAAAGAFPATDAPLQQQLREHFHNSIESTIIEALENGDPLETALDDLQFAWLPAAAELPPFLLQNPAGVSPLPDLQWFPQGADESLQVMAESTLPVVMRSNLPRAATPFNAVAGDQYRIGLIVSDDDYRPDLLQLPQLETEVVDLLYHNGRLHANATVESQILWDQLAAGFDADQHPDIASVPARPATPQTPETILELLAEQDWQAKTAEADLIMPYSNDQPEEPQDLPEAIDLPDPPETSLLTDYSNELTEQERLSDLLADIDDMLEMLEQEKKQQRGLVDALTIDLARLAGGVSGDGSGIKLASAARELSLTARTDSGGEDGGS